MSCLYQEAAYCLTQSDTCTTKTSTQQCSLSCSIPNSCPTGCASSRYAHLLCTVAVSSALEKGSRRETGFATAGSTDAATTAIHMVVPWHSKVYGASATVSGSVMHIRRSITTGREAKVCRQTASGEQVVHVCVKRREMRYSTVGERYGCANCR